MAKKNDPQFDELGNAPLGAPTDLESDAAIEISDHLRPLLADVFAIYMKTNNFHWRHASLYRRHCLGTSGSRTTTKMSSAQRTCWKNSCQTTNA